MQIYDCPASSIQHAAAQAGARLPAAGLAPKGGRRPYYALNLRDGVPAFLDALFALEPTAEVRTAWGRYRGAADWQENRRRERLVGEYEAGGLAQAAAWLRGEGA